MTDAFSRSRSRFADKRCTAHSSCRSVHEMRVIQGAEKTPPQVTNATFRPKARLSDSASVRDLIRRIWLVIRRHAECERSQGSRYGPVGLLEERRRLSPHYVTWSGTPGTMMRGRRVARLAEVVPARHEANLLPKIPPYSRALPSRNTPDEQLLRCQQGPLRMKGRREQPASENAWPRRVLVFW